MAEPLKLVYTPAYIQRLATAIAERHDGFKQREFAEWVLGDDWPQLELKARMQKISGGLHRFLPLPYAQCLDILMPVAAQFGGGELGDYPSMFFPDFVEQFGLDHYEASIPALEEFTKYSSSEFAVRPFIVKYGDRMMAQMQQWAESDNYYVRRLASEGCRPRLPWAMALPQFKQNPQPILPILETLKNDNSLFVRRSVANNLNDIAKDHPDIVIDTCQRWLGQTPETDWLIKHACRSLLKQGHPKALALFGFAPPEHIALTALKVDKQVQLGATLDFNFALNSTTQLGKLRLEYAIDFVKANGKLSRKVFQISESDITATHKTVSKRHSFKVISTRKYYAGAHQLTIIANGAELASDVFIVDC